MKSVLKRNILEDLNIAFFLLSIFSYYFQFPFRSLSGVIVPATIALLIINIKSVIKKFNYQTLFFYSFYAVYISLSMLNAGLHGTSIDRIIRFLLILMLIPLYFNIEVSYGLKKRFYNNFILLSFIKSTIIIAIGLWCLITGEWKIIRFWCLERNLGSIYPSSYFITKVQIIGNPLIVFAFFLHYTKVKKFDFITIVFISAIIFAGNFAFLLGLFGFFVYRTCKFVITQRNKNACVIPLILLVVYVVVFLFLLFASNQQKVKSGHSNVVRVQQFEVLMDCNFFWGEGLGNWIRTDAGLVSYDGQMYFELQTLYIFNQIGIIGIVLFYMLTIFQSCKVGSGRIESFVLYVLYLVYSLWNPYSFDSTQMLAILLLSNFIFGERMNERKLPCYRLLSN